MDFEFETTRTALANAFAAAGADWLGYMGMTDTVVAEIPDTSPQKYAVAGTLKGILSMAGKMMGEDGAEQPTGDLPPLPEPDDVDHVRWAYTADSMRDYARAAIAAHLARQPKAEQPLWDDNGEPWNEAAEKADRAAYLARQAQANSSNFSSSSSVAPAGAQNADQRFYMDHGVWHDRVTGQHLWTQDQYDEQWRDMYKAGQEDAANGYNMLTGKAITPSAGAQNAEAIRNQAYAKCIEIAESELSNTNALMSMPPQSAAAFSIINRIRFLQTGSANTQEGDASAERSGE